MINIEAALNVVNLSALGVPVSEQASLPTIETMPLKFNSHTLPQWRIAISLMTATDPRKGWTQAIAAFIKQCAKDSVYAFHQLQSDNDMILGQLIKARRTVVRFIEQHRIGTQFRTRSTRREVKMTNTGFVLTAMGKSDLIEKPEILTNNLARMGMRGTNAEWCNIWSRDLDKNIKFLVTNEGPDMPSRWHYGYEITIDVFPSIAGNPTASTQQLEQFVLDRLYLPILRAYRPLGLMHRLV